MRNLIRYILKEETNNYEKITKLLKLLINDVFGDSVCGFHWEPMRFVEGLPTPWPDKNLGSCRIVLYFPFHNLRNMRSEEYAEKKKELKTLILEFSIFNQIFVTHNTTKCENQTKSLNENKKRNYLRQLNHIVESYKEDECICDIVISYDEYDDMYSVYVVTSTECMAKKFDNTSTFIVRKINKIKHDIKQEIKSFLPIENIYVGSYEKLNCDWDPVRRIDEDYSPAGKEVTPNEIVVHKSNPMFRDKIMSQGLKARAGECYKIYVGYGEKCIPAIFATNSTNKRAWFDSTYDDDIWFIDTTKIPDVKWFKDKHFESRSKHIVTFQDIPKEAITLKYEGTGSGDLKTWDKKSPNLFENKDEQYSEDRNKLKLITNLINDSDIFDYKHFCGVDIIPPQERTNQYNFSNKNKIPFLIKVYFVGGPNSEVWPRTQAIRNKELDLIENLRDHIKSFVPYNIEMMGSHVNSCEGYKMLMKRKYTTDELQESTKKNDENTDKDLSKKIKLAKSLIYDFFNDEVKSIKQSTYDDKPLLKIYYTTDSKAANHSSWLAEKISEVVMEYTGNNLIFAPWYTFRKKLADIYIGCEELKTHKEEETEGVEGYAAPEFEMKPDHVHFKHLYNESELTERCWKGYTQKGMKTMFGKRYPNCVKKKKK
jgi:hypothetical protein